MSLSYYPSILCSLSLSPLPCTVNSWIHHLYFFLIMLFLSHSSSSGAKLYIKSLICSDALTVHVWVLDSYQHVSQLANQSEERRQSELPGFPCLLVPLLLTRCALAERQEASVYCCCSEAELGLSACLKAECHCCFIVVSTEPTLFHSQ